MQAIRKLYLIINITFALTLTINGQEATQRGLISGKLIDELTSESLQDANIRILTQKDSVFVIGKASNKDGSFSIPIKPGNYIVRISFIGYIDVFKDTIVSNKNLNIKLGTIPLKTDDILLSDAIITAIAPEIIVKGDTVEYNAAYYKVTESAVVEDLLKKMPGVEIDKEGKIVINGMEIKKILVDGKEFFSDDPKIASKNLPAKMVDKIQVMERRSDMSQMTGFDDGDEEAVINLTVRPGMKQGLFGNSLVGYGSQDRFDASAMLNYMHNNDQLTFIGGFNNVNNTRFTDRASGMFDGMGGRGGRGGSGITKSGNLGMNFSKEFSKKLIVGGNVRYGNTNTDRRSKVNTQNLLSTKNTLERENNQSNNNSQNVNMSFRLEWKPDSVTRVIFSPNASFNSNNRSEASDYVTTSLEGDTINYGDSKYLSEGNGKNIGGTLNVSRQLAKKGRVISFSLGGGINNSENKGLNQSNTFYKTTRKDDIIDQSILNTSNSHNMRANVSYVEPIGTNNFIQLSYNYRSNISESDKDTRTKDDAEEYTILDKRYSKRLENNFSNQNLELNFRASREKYNYRIGVSMQPSKSESRTFIGDSLANHTPQSVINFSPMAQFNYLWSRQNNIRINYNGRTNQPSMTQLSPVEDISNPLNISYGNPNLKPTFNHALSIRYRNSNPQKNRSYMFTTNAGFTVNEIVRTRITDLETGRKESTYVNMNGNWSASGRFTTNQPIISKKLSISSSSAASYNNSNGFSNGEENTSKRLNLSEMLNLNFRSDLFDFSLRGNISHNRVKNTLPGQQDQEFLNYGGGVQTSIYIPFDLVIESDITYSTNSGYTDGFEQKEILWNATISQQLFKQKNGTLKFTIYDILKQRSDINRSVTSNYIRDTTSNTLTSYFMFHFAYRFNRFKGGASRGSSMDRRSGMGGEREGGRQSGGRRGSR
ncbi:MAG: outer membrane beta-barrel protein [Dysgonamonadaceae bacterium]|nr:outer membrane beta-barrel protein [Dysgonamonadaceae bacterium]MDD4729780.1 outer membrane beta-barrel protein [Dysgonamonadaceae bacterium]